MTRSSRSSTVLRSSRYVAGLAVLALPLAGCTSDVEPDPVRTAPTANAPVIRPGAPGEPNVTLTGSAAAPLITPTPASPGDTAFYQDMIVHHAQAIVMVETVLERLSDEQVKGIASRIADEQVPEIDVMKRWLESKQQDVPPQATNPRLGGHEHAGMPGMATENQLTELASVSGVAADQLFLTLMIKHHEGALAMVNDHAPTKGGDYEVGKMAAEINVTQMKQIQQMQTMLARLT
ncbi:DUF305 domain-containing protein [Knoellia sp. S7-12]|uniref:DUF305 domain-containing protein n=1 Tax=Knoellia sp. S7-12 TaxID=3126698 RepID=UPI003366F1D3